MNRPEHEMDEFEQALQQAMRRVEVPAETAQKLFALAEGAEAHNVAAAKGPQLIKPFASARVLAFPKARAWWGGAIAATLLVGAFTGEQIHQRHEQRKAERAQQQFDAAMTITNHALDKTRLQLERAGLALRD